MNCSLGVREKIRTALRLRLEMNIPYMSRWHEVYSAFACWLLNSFCKTQAMALGAQPQNVPETLRHISLMVDEIWHVAGDKATDVRCARSILFAC